MGACLLPASGLGPFSLNQQEAAATAYYWANFAWRGNELNSDGIDPSSYVPGQEFTLEYLFLCCSSVDFSRE